MTMILRLLRERFGVFESRSSCARVAIWVAVWAVVVSLVVGPAAPVFTDRDHGADVPASGVRYVGPTSRADTAGFLPPPDEPATFRVAWIGGSEVKLRGVSVPGEFSRRISTVGGEPMLIDSYSVIAPRWIDALRALDTAALTDVDAVVVSLNPAWIRSEWPARGWSSLDVSNMGTLWSRTSTLSWGAALTSPSDVAWRVSRALFPLVEAQHTAHDDARELTEPFDIIDEPDEPYPADPPDRRFLGDSSSFWLAEEYGDDVLYDEDERVAAMMAGIGVSQAEAEFFARLFAETAADLDVPVLLYAAPFSAESLAKPEFAQQAEHVRAFWDHLAADIDDPSIAVISSWQTDDFPQPGLFINNVHMADAGPFADLLVEQLCAQWAAQGSECT